MDFECIFPFQIAKQRFHDHRYLLQVNVNELSKEAELHLLFEVDATVSDIVHAFTIALLIRQELGRKFGFRSTNTNKLLTSVCNVSHQSYNELSTKYLSHGKLTLLEFHFLNYGYGLTRLPSLLGEHSEVVDRFVQEIVNSREWHIAVNVLEEKIARIRWN